MRSARLVTAVAVSAGLIAALASCSTDKGDSGKNNSSGGSASDTVNITTTSAQPTFVRNWNGFSPAEKKSPGATLFYEPLIRINHLAGKKPEGWLAKSFAWSDNGKTLTFKLREGVKFSDGKPFTSKDVKYTYEAPVKTKGLALAALGYKSLETPDANTVVIKYAKTSYQRLSDYAARNIYPQHLWAKQDPKKWTNPNPVGTGPATLRKFSPQQVGLKFRDDYWGGKSKGVKNVNIKAFATPEAAKAMLLKGELSFSSLNWQDAQEQYISKNPKTNKYFTFDTGGDEGLNFNTAKPPLDDVHVRRALAFAADPKKLLKLAVTGQNPAGVSGFSPTVYKDLIAPAYAGKLSEPDLAAAKAELKKSTYKLNKAGVFTKGGKSYPLTIKPIVEYTNWVAWGDGIAEQWKQNLGAKVKVIRTPEAQLPALMQKGDYEIAFDWQASGDSPASGYDANLHSKNTAPIGKVATTNYTRWNDKATDKLLDQWTSTNDPAKGKEYAAKLQKTVVDKVPFRPLFSGAWFAAFNTKDWSGWPEPDTATHVPQPGLAPDFILTLLNITPTK